MAASVASAFGACAWAVADRLDCGVSFREELEVAAAEPEVAEPEAAAAPEAAVAAAATGGKKASFWGRLTPDERSLVLKHRAVEIISSVRAPPTRAE